MPKWKDAPALTVKITQPNPKGTMVRQEAIQRVADSMLNRPSATHGATPPTAAEVEEAANRWISSIREHDKWNKSPLFRNKARGHGQYAGSTDGRLLRKLIMAATQKAVISNPHFDPYRSNIIAARNRLNDAERALRNDPRNTQLQQKHTDAKQELSNQSQRLNAEVAMSLNNLLSQPGGHSALKKAIFLTKEKLRDPLGYKQKYARLVPFGKDDKGNDKWVKASRRFYIPANGELPLPPKSDGTARDTSVVKMGQPPANLPPFGSGELIEDVGQKDLGECWLQSSAASLPRQTLGNIFSWSPSHGSEGVTTRLHDENGRPIYIRTRKKQLWNNASDHKALWPAALAAATAKVGRKAIREIRHGKIFGHNSGLPLYSVRDVYANTIAAAANLLTGKDPLEVVDVSGLSPIEKENLLSQAQARAERVGALRGVASFGNFDKPTGGDYGEGHAGTWLGNNTFGNPWAASPGEPDDGSVSHGKKIFKALLSRVRGAGFLDPSGASPRKNMFVPASSSAFLTPDEYKEERTRRIGNLFTRPR